MKKLFRQIGSVFQTQGRDAGHEPDLPSSSNRMWMEQDLWSQVAATDAAMDAGPVRQTRRATEFDFSATEIVRQPARRTTTVRATAVGEAYALRQRAARAVNIARFMEVNRTIESDRGAVYRVIQKVKGVSADYDLWKGPTRQVTFLLG